jgi:hypothetical protein
MRIGYSYWGFLGDYKEDKEGNELSTPDGNAAYGGALIRETQRQGHRVIMMQQDRDWPTFQRRGRFDFSSFDQEDRFQAYLSMDRAVSLFTGGPALFPSLDVLLLEWRMPIPGRNIDIPVDHPDYQPDLQRQRDLLHYYSSVSKERRPKAVIIWDLDHKLTFDDEKMLGSMFPNVVVFETSWTPRSLYLPRVRVEPPVAVQSLLQHTPKALNPKKKLVYVGSRYERDDIIEEWIKPVSARFKGEVHFYGNWTREQTLKECKAMWPHVQYHGRIAMKDFFQAYGDAVACPLLAKKSYLETGFITPRIWEALIFGTLPIGLATHNGIEEYLPRELIANDAEDLGNKVQWLSTLSASQREILRRDVAEKIRFMDASYFVDRIERAARKE